ncbi:MAG: helix-turn-helix domain-containing protein [Roseburia sp.]|nr:helix-turn-helix domain-containing protein [Roseburia sp.]
MRNWEIFAKKLKEIRLQTGKTQKEFANMVESTAATISAYENATKQSLSNLPSRTEH